MKKIFLLIMGIVITFTLVACGGVETNNSNDIVDLVEVTSEEGISLKIPSDMEIQEVEGNQIYVNSKTGDNVVFQLVEDFGMSLSEWTKEDALATYQKRDPEATIESFENKQINGKNALVAMVNITTEAGSPITVVLVLINDGDVSYVVNFTYGSDSNDSSLAKSIQTCIESITI